ncbi:MAG: acetoacetate--CoA ligase, partial [Pseudomonadota bacterium]|nr:acetoacetate--CoA ligase [Pseudomonadota bacterium]
MTNEQPLWTPTQEFISQTNMAAFMDFVKNKTGQSFDDYNSLGNWSVDTNETFWDRLWDGCGEMGERGETSVSE